jgi:UDP:flavonoid glycosyltransferase YjiC (YdhE family)
MAGKDHQDNQTGPLGKIIAKNTVFVTLGNIALKLLNFLFTVYIVRSLGDERFGQYSIVLAFVAIFQIFAELGVSQYVRREIARDKSKTEEYVWNLMTIRVVKEIGLPMIEKGEDLLHGDLYLVPSIPALDPLSEASDTYYVGPLAKPATDRSSLPEWAAELNPAKPLVYITLGGGAGPVGGPEFYTLLFDALSREDIQVVASTGSRITREDIPKPPANFRLETWVPGQAVIEMADLVVYPGGYGTTMELVRAGTPGLVIPFHTEQESNGRRLEQQGAGMMLLSAVEGAVIQEKPWFGSCFSYMVFPKTSLSPSILRSSIKRLLEDPVYAQKADHLRATASSYPGASLAADLVEDISKTFSPSTKGWDRLSWRQKLGLSFPSF